MDWTTEETWFDSGQGQESFPFAKPSRPGGLCGHMILRAMRTVAYAAARASHARQVNGDDPDEKGYPGPPGWGVGRWGWQLHTVKTIFSETQQSASEGRET